ncbi:Nucleoid-associated protein [Streptococcus agalactiae]|nr:Nucleoid-associated protein [Streptococcus agalactiae]
MMNMQNMMRQAQKLQKQMEQKQADLAASQFTGKSAQELVTVTFTGDKKLISIDYKEAVVDPEDIETLQDMTTQAINDALSQVDDATKNYGSICE